MAMMGGLMCSTFSPKGEAASSPLATAGVAEAAGNAAAAAGVICAVVSAASGVEASAAAVCGECAFGRLEIRSTTGRGAGGAALTGAGAGVGATDGAFFAPMDGSGFKPGRAGRAAVAVAGVDALALVGASISETACGFSTGAALAGAAGAGAGAGAAAAAGAVRAAAEREAEPPVAVPVERLLPEESLEEVRGLGMIGKFGPKKLGGKKGLAGEIQVSFFVRGQKRKR